MRPEQIHNANRNNLPTGYDSEGRCVHPRILQNGDCDTCGETLRLWAISNVMDELARIRLHRHTGEWGVQLGELDQLTELHRLLYMEAQ